jgi:hypothetical protein
MGGVFYEPVMGLAAWAAIGVTLGILARVLLPGGDRGCLSVVVAMGGAVAGGAAATVLGAGGALDLDGVGLLVAGLAAALAVVLLRLFQGRRGGPGSEGGRPGR